jgi:secreted PhoX family phosphatase
VLTLDQDPATGHLSLVKYHNVDMSSVHGLWITCGASLSPWGTHLSSEEYEPDAFDQGLGGQSLATLKAFSKNTFGDTTKANPYNYGHLPEITVNADGTGTARKHYCLGRISHELIQVMPDERTALMGDDYTNGGLFMFVADKAKDLSAGTLYVAKYVDRLTDTSTAKLQWIKLGHATSQEIDDLVNVANIQPADIMDSTKTNPADASYTRITVNKTAAWVRVKAGREKAAAFLETHRYAALKGGSMAFTKMEGTTVNARDKIAYSALANIQDSMVVGASGYVEANNVAFPKIVAGGVVAHDLAGGQKDSDGDAIASEWVPTQSRLLLRGQDIAADTLGNTAHPDTIASPDNLKFSEKLRTLFIGEDSGNHLNNFLWAYNVDTKKLERILSCPAGAESTGLHAVDEINGWTYIMSNFQHAGDEWNRFPGLNAALKGEIDAIINARYNSKASSAVGYLTAEAGQPKLGT